MKIIKKTRNLLLPILLIIIFLVIFSFFQNNTVIELISRFQSDVSFETFSPELKSAQILGENTMKPTNLKKNMTSSLKYQDKREYVLDMYFASRNSPLTGYAWTFVKACDKYGAPRDCITTAAIVRHETDLCNYYVSAQEFNCMGWGGGPGYRRRFDSFEHHLDVATDVLVNQYGIQYMIDPSLMERVFCGPQAECDNWGNRVKYFMRVIDDYSEQLGVGRLTDLR